VALALACTLAAGCASAPGPLSGGPLAPAPSGPSQASTDVPNAARAQSQSYAGGKTVAIVGDTALTQADLLPLLAEAAGGQVLDDLALSLAVRTECDKRSIRVTDALVRDERRLLARQLAISARVPENEGEGLIAGVRRTRGLGDRRFRLLLETNAGLRALIRADPDRAVTITPEDIQTAYQLKHGPRIRARLILVRSRDAASQAAQALAAGRDFADVAAQFSVDPSASRGGQIEPVSPADSSYPVGVRRALQTLSPGQTSDPIPVEWGGNAPAGSEAGFVIVKPEATVTPATTPPAESVAQELETEIRIVRERARMQRLGSQLVRSAGVSVVDPALAWSWDVYRGESGR